MASIGPQLSPHLVGKRKRDDAGGEEGSSRSPSPESATKQKRTIGPLPPPAPLIERPSESPNVSPRVESEPVPANGDSSSDDDDFGPALPTAKDQASLTSQVSSKAAAPTPTPSESTQRDAWMIVPPTSGDWTSRVDPTKLKARAFKTGKSASAPKDNSRSDTWNETPQEKQARLKREMMGIKDPKSTTDSTAQTPTVQETQDDRDTRKRIKEYNAARGPSLYDAHQKGHQVEKEDDPSARAFDREKDIAGGLQMNATQRRDMMKKAGDFSTRFSSAKYL